MTRHSRAASTTSRVTVPSPFSVTVVWGGWRGRSRFRQSWQLASAGVTLDALAPGSFRRERPDSVPSLTPRPLGERVQALQEHRGGLIIRPAGQARGEGRTRLVPRPAAVGSQALGEAVAQIARRHVDLARAAEDLEDALRRAPARDEDRVDLAQLESVSGQPRRLLAH